MRKRNFGGLNSEDYKAIAARWADAVRKYAAGRDGYRATVGGDYFTISELENILRNDLIYVVIGVSLVFIYTSIQLDSGILAFATVALISLTIPTSLYLYSFHDPCMSLSILNIMGVYIVIGVGLDDIFMFCGLYQYYKSSRTVQQRFALAYLRSEEHLPDVPHNQHGFFMHIHSSHSHRSVLLYFNGDYGCSKLHFRYYHFSRSLYGMANTT